MVVGKGEVVYKPTARCPRCGRPPAVRFSGAEVKRARRERQRANVQTAECSRCRTRYWIRAREIAEAQPERSGRTRRNGGLPTTLPDYARSVLVAAGIETVEELLEVEDYQSISGVGPATARAIEGALSEAGLARERPAP